MEGERHSVAAQSEFDETMTAPIARLAPCRPFVSERKGKHRLVNRHRHGRAHHYQASLHFIGASTYLLAKTTRPTLRAN